MSHTGLSHDEWLPFLCFCCGIIGHDERGCSNKFRDELQGISKQNLWCGKRIKADQIGKALELERSHNESHENHNSQWGGTIDRPKTLLRRLSGLSVEDPTKGNANLGSKRQIMGEIWKQGEVKRVLVQT